MSSTARGRDREEDDTYFTRYPTALAICERLKADGVITGAERMMEPSAGAGAFVSAMAEVWAPRTLYSNDIDCSLMLPEHWERARLRIESEHPGRTLPDGRLIALEGDFLALSANEVAGLQAIIGNCPYNFAEQHIRHALSLLAPGGTLAFLLRMNFLSGIERAEGLWTEHPPEYIYTLDKRPTFKEVYRINKKGKRVKGTTDSCEYGMFVWRKERPEFEPVIRWLRWSHYLKRFKNKVERIEITSDSDRRVDEQDGAG